MSRYFFLWVKFMVCLNTGLAQGIVFTETSIPASIERGMETGKDIFVEVYGPWCSICRRMEKKVFTQQEVGDFFNQNFINLRLNGDATSNSTFIETAGIQAYPTFLILDPQGQILSKQSGSMDGLELIMFGTQSLAFESFIGKSPEDYQSNELQSNLLNFRNWEDPKKWPYFDRWIKEYYPKIDSSSMAREVIFSMFPIVTIDYLPLIDKFLQEIAFKDFKKEDLKKLDRRLQFLSRHTADLEKFLTLSNFRKEAFLLLSDKYPVSAAQIAEETALGKLDVLRMNENKQDYLLEAPSFVSEFLTAQNIQEVNRMDGFLNMELTPNNPRHRAKFLSENLNQVSLNYYRWADSESQLKQALDWIEYSIKLFPTSRKYLIKAGILDRLKKTGEAKGLLEQASRLPGFAEDEFLFSHLVSKYGF